jgi:hypothetical protein
VLVGCHYSKCMVASVSGCNKESVGTRIVTAACRSVHGSVPLILHFNCDYYLQQCSNTDQWLSMLRGIPDHHFQVQ